MELQKVTSLQDAWQRAVREHASFLRDARAAKLTPHEIHKRGRIHLLRIDVAFSKLKAAEMYGRELN